jgi:glycosyltransferase involved in cell wall biosynthesis
MREGGLERVVMMMSSPRGSDPVHVAAVLESGEAEQHPFVTRLTALGVAVTPIVVKSRSYLREYRLLSDLVGRLKPGIVHTHGYRADVIGGAVARSRRIPTVSTVHGFTGGGFRNRFYELLQRIALRRANAVMAVSGPLTNLLVRAGIPRTKVHCVPNGFAPAAQMLTRAAARDALGIPADSLVAGWVGRLSPEKGPDVMLDALASCDGEWRLSMIGEGREGTRLRQRAEVLGIAHRVRWHGAVADAGSMLAAFDAFVLSSRTEGTPIALLEAMYAGVPIVATRVGGVSDIVTQSDAILVPAQKPEAIARALEQIARERPAAQARSVHARNTVLRSFGAAPWLAAVDSVYRAASRDVARIDYYRPTIQH